MKVTLKASTGATILVWRDDTWFCAHRLGGLGEPQVCLGVDLFEVVAELAELNLDVESHAQEAIRLADYAQQRLQNLPPAGPEDTSGFTGGFSSGV